LAEQFRLALAQLLGAAANVVPQSVRVDGANHGQVDAADEAFVQLGLEPVELLFIVS
jgi:hypothetical protein